MREYKQKPLDHYDYTKQIGDRYGRLVVSEIHSKIRIKNTSHLLVKCICDCGKTKIVRKSTLANGDAKSCGCLKKEIENKSPGLAASKIAYANLRERVKIKNKEEFDISFEDFIYLSKLNCYYCDSEPTNKTQGSTYSVNGDFVYNGLDRVDNTKGYTKDNVVPCCKWCNRAKSTLTLEEFRIRAGNVYRKFEKEMVDRTSRQTETIINYLEQFAKNFNVELPPKNF